MRFTTLVAMLACFPPIASAQEVMSIQSAHAGPLLRSGVDAVQRLSLEQDRVAAQLHQTKLKNDKKTTIILIAIVAVAAIVWFEIEFDGI